MGDPVRIAGLAEFLIERTGRSIAIEYTGLRTGEKLHEVLLGESERGDSPFHPLIMHVPVPSLPPEILGSIDASAPRGPLVDQLRAAATEAGILWPVETEVAGHPMMTSQVDGHGSGRHRRREGPVLGNAPFRDSDVDGRTAARLPRR
jgi:hypothetical protein